MQILKNVVNFFSKIWHHKKGKIGLIMFFIIILAIIFAPLLTPYDPYQYDLNIRNWQFQLPGENARFHFESLPFSLNEYP